MKALYVYIPLMMVFMLSGYSLHAQTVPVREDVTAHYDFWVGEWNATWQEGDNGTGRGTNRIEKTLDGMVLQEHFRVHEGQQAGFKGTSISVYNPNTQQWKQAWADNQGSYFDFTGATDGDKRIFRTAVTELAGGNLFVQRMVFYDITNDAFTWDWESSTDGGTTWTLNWRINYTRIKN